MTRIELLEELRKLSHEERAEIAPAIWELFQEEFQPTQRQVRLKERQNALQQILHLSEELRESGLTAGELFTISRQELENRYDR